MAIQRRGPGFATLNAALKDLDGVEGKAGWFATARYADKHATPVAQVAAWNEFGFTTHKESVAHAYQGGGTGGRSVHVPPRPFMRQTVTKEGPAWMALIGRGATAALAGKVTGLQVLESVALKAAADVGVTISEFTSPPNAPSVIKRKGIDAPLRDTKQMLQSVTGIAEKTK